MIEQNHDELISRRRVLRAAVGVASGVPTSLVNAQSREAVRADPRRMKLVDSIENSVLLGLSPDGQHVCVYCSRRPNQRFVFRRGNWSEAAGKAADDEALRVINLASAKRAFSIQLRASAFAASFFQMGGAVYIETVPFTERDRLLSQQAVVNIRAGTLSEHLAELNPKANTVLYYALEDGTLLGTVTDWSTRRNIALSRVRWPDYKELMRVPFDLDGVPLRNRQSDFAFSLDRTTVAYRYDQTVVCRRTADLRLVWTVQVEQSDSYPLGISSDGGRVAIGVSRKSGGFVVIYDGVKGIALTQIQTYGDLAISHSGKLLAVGRKIPDRASGSIQLVVDLFEIDTGRMIDSVIHDVVPSGRDQFLNAMFSREGLQFTPDNGRVIVSGNNKVKVWEITDERE